MGTGSKSKVVHETKKFLKNHGYELKAKNADLYRNKIPNGLGNAAKNLGYLSVGINLVGNTSEIIQTGQIGLGNIVDMSLSVCSVVPGWGTAVTLIYLGVDYGWYLYAGQSIRESLNNEYTIRILNK